MAEILTGTELVLNRGSDDGVQVGMRFAILNRKGAAIMDPDTGEALGSVDLEKTVVKVVRVDPRLSVARTFRTYRSGGQLAGASFARMFEPSVVRVETLRTDERKLKDELDESESYVKIGDPAVQVVGEEFEDKSE